MTQGSLSPLSRNTKTFHLTRFNMEEDFKLFINHFNFFTNPFVCTNLNHHWMLSAKIDKKNQTKFLKRFVILNHKSTRHKNVLCQTYL